jgi:hypothetical protein
MRLAANEAFNDLIPRSPLRDTRQRMSESADADLLMPRRSGRA